MLTHTVVKTIQFMMLVVMNKAFSLALLLAPPTWPPFFAFWINRVPDKRTQNHPTFVEYNFVVRRLTTWPNEF